MNQRTQALATRLHDTVVLHADRHYLGVAEKPRSHPGHIATLDLLSGTMAAHGMAIHLPPAVLSVVVALAIHDHPVSRELLADALYPESDLSAAMNSLKVNIHRARRRTGLPDLVHHEGGRYALGWCVDVDLRHVEGVVRGLRQNGISGCEPRAWLLRIRGRLHKGRPSFMLRWPWFEETERRLMLLNYAVTMLLAEDALAERRYDDVLAFAEEILRDDPVDELAAEVAIRAAVQAGDRVGAITQYRRYQNAWLRELSEQPPETLRRLVTYPTAG